MKHKLSQSLLLGYLVFNIALLCGVPTWNDGFIFNKPDASDIGFLVGLIIYLILDMVESYLPTKKPKIKSNTITTVNSDYTKLLHRLQNSDDERIDSLLIDWFYVVAGSPNQGSHILPDGRSWSLVNSQFMRLIDEGSYTSAVLLLLPNGYEVKVDVDSDHPTYWLKHIHTGNVLHSTISIQSLALADIILRIKVGLV